MANDWYVRVVEKETGETVKQIGPMDERKADRVENGLLINLDYERFYTEMVQKPSNSGMPPPSLI